MKTFKELFISEANLTGKTMKLKKDYAEYKKGTEVEVLEFKGSGQYRVQFPDKKTDVIGVSALVESQVLDEKVTWNHAEVAAQDVFNDLKSSGYKVKKSGNNGLKITHDNGCVGNVVFDPSLKESLDGLEEARAKFDTKKFILRVEAQVRALKDDAKFSEDQGDWNKLADRVEQIRNMMNVALKEVGY